MLSELGSGSDVAAAGKLIKREHREIGSVNWRVYISHIRACGPLVVIPTLLLMITYQALLVATNMWISSWASHSTTWVSEQPLNSTQVRR